MKTLRESILSNTTVDINPIIQDKLKASGFGTTDVQITGDGVLEVCESARTQTHNFYVSAETAQMLNQEFGIHTIHLLDPDYTWISIAQQDFIKTVISEGRRSEISILASHNFRTIEGWNLKCTTLYIEGSGAGLVIRDNQIEFTKTPDNARKLAGCIFIDDVVTWNFHSNKIKNCHLICVETKHQYLTDYLDDLGLSRSELSASQNFQSVPFHNVVTAKRLLGFKDINSIQKIRFNCMAVGSNHKVNVEFQFQGTSFVAVKLSTHRDYLNRR